nr:spermatogenesis-associated protein 46 [Columba livia]
MENFALPTVSLGAVPRVTRTRSSEAPCAWGPDSLAVPQGSELPARYCTIYRPWFSPYSYYMCTKGASQQHPSSPSSSLDTSTQEPAECDDLSEIVCSSSDSSDNALLTNRDSLASDKASITVQDILAASQQQSVPQRGYQCMSCCRVFPTLWSIKTHIQHSSREGYSCKLYYRRLKALWEKGHKELEAAATV